MRLIDLSREFDMLPALKFQFYNSAINSFMRLPNLKSHFNFNSTIVRLIVSLRISDQLDRDNFNSTIVRLIVFVEFVFCNMDLISILQ